MYFILAQIFAGIAMLLNIVSMQIKRKRVFIYFQIGVSLFFGLGQLLLHAQVAFVLSSIAIVRMIAYYLLDEKRFNKKSKVISAIIFSLINIAVIALYWDGFSILLVLALHMSATWVLISKDILVIKIGFIFVALFSILYILPFGGYVNAAADMLTSLSNMVFIFKYIKYKNTDKTNTTNYLKL